MNKLYGWGMSGYIPYGGFKLLKNVDGFEENSPIEYPDQLHAFPNNQPLVPGKLAIPYDMLSDYCKKMQTNIE